MRLAPALLVLILLAATGSTGAQGVRPPEPPGSRAGAPAPAPPPVHRPGELDCQNCHQGKHQGVARMYLGLGGRGTPMIPSHMVQVRVECAACHTAPKEEESWAGIVGQTFRPSEQACLGCHGEKYRGMLGRWSGTLARMQEILAPKLAAARGAVGAGDPKDPKRVRAGRLLDDAEFNSRFVALAKGVHNVFYAADLLKLANGWVEEAAALAGKPIARGDDTLVRGGYCAVLCHEQAGVKLKDTVTFAERKLPHARHTTEFGAVCTSCHSAEVHKAVTATPASCTACHHGPQNDRCEGCHRAQSTFYRGGTGTGQGGVAPNLMAEIVPCVGCHDLARKHSRAAVGEKCRVCHEQPYLALLDEWTVGFDRDAGRAAAALQRAEAVLASARKAGRPAAEGEALVKEARRALALVRGARGAHNPLAADTLLEGARQKAEAALATVGRK
jgi:hypothetical protein